MSDRHDDIGRLGAALERIRSPFDDDEAVSIALEGARASRGRSRRTRASGLLTAAVGAVSGAIGAVATRLGELRARSRYALIGTAAAAVAAVLLVPSPDPAEPNPARLVAPGSAAGAAATEGFSIEAPEDGGMAVFQTSNPRIRVVWFYDATGSGG